MSQCFKNNVLELKNVSSLDQYLTFLLYKTAGFETVSTLNFYTTCGHTLPLTIKYYVFKFSSDAFHFYSWRTAAKFQIKDEELASFNTFSYIESLMQGLKNKQNKDKSYCFNNMKKIWAQENKSLAKGSQNMA